ncbi:MAG: dihydrofolate reductase [Bacteroidia bacterium]|nr:dihydrofolate reductase [Bacteroidia bacterium]
MRNIKLFISCSTDGFIARPDGDISWLDAVATAGEDYGYAAFYDTVDTIVLGRKTYDKVLSFGIEFPHKNKTTYVITHTPRASEGNIHFYTGDLTALIQQLKATGTKDVFIDGGAELVHALLSQRLIDEIIISYIPVLLGEGIRLFKDGFPEQKLKLTGVKSFSSGLVQVVYEVLR